MGDKKVFSSVVVDGKTGEILESRSVFVNSALEQFGMFRTTDGIEWLIELSEIEIKILALFHVWSEDSGAIQFTPVKRDFVLRKLNISAPTLSRGISGLIKKGTVLRMGRFDFIINPATFFKGSSKELKVKINNYIELKRKMHEF